MSLLLLVMSGVASQIHPIFLSLADVAQQSAVIVLVEDATPPGRDILLPAGSVPMPTRLARVRVLEVLRAPEGQLAPQQLLEVGEADLPMTLESHRMYYDEGISESPFQQVLEGGAPNTGTRVLFLNPCPMPSLPSLLCLSAAEAVAAPEKLSDIRALIAGAQP